MSTAQQPHEGAPAPPPRRWSPGRGETSEDAEWLAENRPGHRETLYFHVARQMR